MLPVGEKHRSVFQTVFQTLRKMLASFRFASRSGGALSAFSQQQRAFGASGGYVRHWEKQTPIEKDPKRVIRPIIGADHLWVPSKPWNYPTGRLDPWNPKAACSDQGGGNEGIPPEYVDIMRTQQQITPLELGWVSYTGTIFPLLAGGFAFSMHSLTRDNDTQLAWLYGY